MFVPTPRTALAMGYTNTGAITINNVDGQSTGFDGYQIFKAMVRDTDNAAGKAPSKNDLTWASDGVANVLTDYIKSVDDTYAGETAQDASDWVALHMGQSDVSTSVSVGDYDETLVDSDSMAYALANAMARAGIKPTHFDSGAQKTIDSGYWLFISDASKVSDEESDITKPIYEQVDGESGSAPIYAVIGGSPVTVTVKGGPVTILKEVSEDGKAFAFAVDAQAMHDLTYRLTGTLPRDYSTFATYHYRFEDHICKGLAMDATSVKVTAYADANDNSGTDVTDKASIDVTDNDSLGGQSLVVDFLNLKESIPNLTASSRIVVTYMARLDPTVGFEAGMAGNPNEARLVYTKDPHSLDDGTTVYVGNKVYTFSLHLVKLDAATMRPITQRFTMQLTDTDGDSDIDADGTPDNGDGVGKYVQDDGSLADTPYEFETSGTKGFSVSGLDAGTYTIHEMQPEDGYDAINDFTVRIESTIDQKTATCTALSNTVTTDDPEHVVAGLHDDDAESDASTGISVIPESQSDVEHGIVNVTVADTKPTPPFTPPFTPQEFPPYVSQLGDGTTKLVAVVIGGAIIIVGIAVARKTRESGK